MLEKVRIVLVNTTHPGNIGAAARAMKTMGLSELVLVQPQQFPHGLATGMASNADDLLTKAKVVPTLQEALKGCGLVLGTSARIRSLSWRLLTPEEAATEALAHTQTADVAIVFGREKSGLTNEELQQCHAHICIPANEEYNVLNLAQAVQIICYEFRKTLLRNETLPDYREPLASHDEVQRLYSHMQLVLEKLQFYDPANAKQLMPRLKRMFSRIKLEKREISILRGAFKAILEDKR